MAQKLVNRDDIMKDLIDNVTPRYFPDEALDQNRTSVYGYLTESEAKSIEDTITLEQRRAIDYCPELSNSEIRVRQTAKIRGVEVSRAEPGKAFAIIGVLKDDILNKGEKINNEIRFVIDRRSSIVHDGIPFSLEDDIIIRAVRRPSGYVYAASYSGEHVTYQSYIQMYEQINDQGQEMVTMLLQIYQCNYNIQEKAVTDAVSFLYDGLSFDYENLLAGFEVYYKRTASEDYKRLELTHYLSTETTRSIYYNDDDSNILYILNNPVLNIGVNAMIRVEIKETLGTDGMIILGGESTTFSLYRDENYNYAGINILISLISDTVAADNGDSMADIKAKLIDAKTRRDNITTEHDIISYINNIDANVQIIKKRNDIEDRRVYMYTLLRLNKEIVPATTRRMHLIGVQSPVDFADIDEYEQLVDRKVIRAYNKFKLVLPDGYPDNEDYLVKVPRDEQEEGALYYTCPFMILINDLNILSYYFTTINQNILMNSRQVDTMYPFQMITRGVSIFRNSHDPQSYDKYLFTVIGTLNTSNDSDLLDDKGNIKDFNSIVGYLIFRNDNTVAAYLPLHISTYNPETREFTFQGYCVTNDFITEQDKLHITKGLYKAGTDIHYNSVIDFRDGLFDLVFTYKDAKWEEYPKTDAAYSILPSAMLDGYVVSNAYYNATYNPYNLLLEFNKFTSSPVTVKPYTETTVQYSIAEVPMIEYEYGIKNIVNLYGEFENLLQTYGSLLKLTTDFDISLKFIATYGRSKYIWISGGRNAEGEEETVNLMNLNPKFYFRVYGQDAPIDDIRQFIYEYLRDTYITDQRVFVSNICTLVEQKFNRVKSIKFMGIDEYDGSYQEFNYITPEFINADVVYRFVPEQLNVTDINIDLDED